MVKLIYRWGGLEGLFLFLKMLGDCTLQEARPCRFGIVQTLEGKVLAPLGACASKQNSGSNCPVRYRRRSKGGVLGESVACPEWGLGEGQDLHPRPLGQGALIGTGVSFWSECSFSPEVHAGPSRVGYKTPPSCSLMVFSPPWSTLARLSPA